MWAPNDRRWLPIFLAFAISVAGVLAWLHLASTPQMEEFGDTIDQDYDGIILAPDAPKWFAENGELMQEKLPSGYKLPPTVEAVNGFSRCTAVVDRETISLPCVSGHVVVTLWDRVVSDCSADDCEAGGAFVVPQNRSCTIMLPANVLDALPIGMMTSEDAPELPADIEALLGAHEYVHCRRGKGHAFTRVFGPVVSIPTGHLMHPNILKAGWDTTGLEED